MTETFMTILQWLIPSGSTAAVLGWLTSKNLRQLRTYKEFHDTYKVMYENLSATVETLKASHAQVERSLGLYKIAIEESALCRYRRKCPVNRMRKEIGLGVPFEVENAIGGQEFVEPEEPP